VAYFTNVGSDMELFSATKKCQGNIILKTKKNTYFCFSSKGCLHPFLFATSNKVVATACKTGKSAKIIIAETNVQFCNLPLTKGCVKLCMSYSIARYPFEQFACGICKLHATPIMFAIYGWENLN
jgi:hypothetical protein